ncbi:MAG: hypothetical protein PHP62_00215 [Candidatus Moranbacteria bacterium]|nr:hypothetical protein [Candidatus Moranbacteria bacterium]
MIYPISPAVPMWMVAISAKNLASGMIPVAMIKTNSTEKNPRPTRNEFVKYDLPNDSISIRLEITIYLKTSSTKTPMIINWGIIKSCKKEMSDGWLDRIEKPIKIISSTISAPNAAIIPQKNDSSFVIRDCSIN